MGPVRRGWPLRSRLPMRFERLRPPVQSKKKSQVSEVAIAAFLAMSPSRSGSASASSSDSSSPLPPAPVPAQRQMEKSHPHRGVTITHIQLPRGHLHDPLQARLPLQLRASHAQGHSHQPSAPLALWVRHAAAGRSLLACRCVSNDYGRLCNQRRAK